MTKTFLTQKQFISLGILISIGIGLYYWYHQQSPQEIKTAIQRPEMSVSQVLGDEQGKGYAKALSPRPFEFPEDHGPHPQFRNEWWYFTGNLESPEGRRFGYQFTLFRTALDSVVPQRSSAWATNQAYMGHLALTDMEGKEFYTDERFSRAALDLAGAQSTPFRVWLEDWEVHSSTESFWPLRISAKTEKFTLDLHLQRNKKRVLQGNKGLSQKGKNAGNASYYYSYTQIATHGSIVMNGITHAVDGMSWMDREWSTSALEEGQVGWDWFSLQLEHDWEIMFYQIRLKNGLPDVTSSGMIVDPEGNGSYLRYADVEVSVIDNWRSPQTQIQYPAQWMLSIPSQKIFLTIRPYLAHQEWNHAFQYWEGAVAVEGEHRAKPVKGQGYVELTGY